jgi:hypothetical protein
MGAERGSNSRIRSGIRSGDPPEPPIAGIAAALNLPLAARLRVGHIRLTGDVAEWLKAAVC